MEANLLRRILAAIVLVPAVVASVLWLPHAWFAGAAALFMAVGSWEWAGLSGRASTTQRVAYTVLTLALMLWLSLHLRHPGALLAACAVGVAWWAVALFRVVSAQRGTGTMSTGMSACSSRARSNRNASPTDPNWSRNALALA